MPGNVCDVCRSTGETFVCSSSLGAISFAFCRTCLELRAEPLDVLLTTIWTCGGPDKVAEWTKTTPTYADGHYLTWDEVVARYPAFEEDFDRGLRELEERDRHPK